MIYLLFGRWFRGVSRDARTVRREGPTIAASVTRRRAQGGLSYQWKFGRGGVWMKAL